MKLQSGLVLFCVVAFVWTCAPKPAVTPEPSRVESADELFSRAEKLYETESYQEALEVYEEYYRLFPDKPLSAAALMKIGIIQLRLENYENARMAFQRIISGYPSSSFAPDAMVEELFTYYQQGRYQEVINRGLDLVARMDSRAHLFRTYALIGDAYLIRGAVIDAIDYYARARESATVLEQEAILNKLKEAIAQLDTADVAILVNHPDESLPMDFLMFQLGLNYALEEKYEDALKVLNQFLEKYPQNENRILVESLIDEIKKNSVFNRYTIGCLLPLSGPYQTFGYRALKGIELAYDRFSSKSDHPPINLIVKDSGSDPDKTLVALEELGREQVAAILGPIVTVEIAAREAQARGIPILTITQKDNIPEIGDKVFRNFITPKMQVQALTTFAIESLGVNRFAILYPEETYGITFMNLFWDQLLQLGGRVVGVEAYNPAQTDFTDPIKKLVGLYYEVPEDLKAEKDPDSAPREGTPSGKPQDKSRQNGEQKDDKEAEPEPVIDFDAIFIPDSPKKAGIIVPQLAYHDVNDVYLLGTNLWHSDSLIKIADQYVQGAVMPDGFFADSESPRVKEFVKVFYDTYQVMPEFIEAVVYDSAMILFNAVSQPHVRYRSDIRDELLNMEGYPGVTGLTRFDENGDAQKKLHLLRVKGKKFVELE